MWSKPRPLCCFCTGSRVSVALYSSRCKSSWVSKSELLEALLTSAGSKGWDAWCRHKPLALLSEVSYLWAPSQFHQFQVTRLGVFFFFFCEITSLLLLPVSMWLFYPLLQRSCSASFQVILIGIFPCVVVNLLCPWKEMNPGPSYTTILNHLLPWSLSSLIITI